MLRICFWERNWHVNWLLKPTVGRYSLEPIEAVGSNSRPRLSSTSWRNSRWAEFVVKLWDLWKLPPILSICGLKELTSILGNGFLRCGHLASQMLRNVLMNGHLVGSRGSVDQVSLRPDWDTEVNPPPHLMPVVASQWVYHRWFRTVQVSDMPNKDCPKCGHKLIKTDRIFRLTFLGFCGDKVPGSEISGEDSLAPTDAWYLWWGICLRRNGWYGGCQDRLRLCQGPWARFWKFYVMQRWNLALAPVSSVQQTTPRGNRCYSWPHGCLWFYASSSIQQMTICWMANDPPFNFHDNRWERPQTRCTGTW